jgi:hypothetical protein
MPEDTKPKLEIVPKRDPASVFNDLAELRRKSKLTVKRRVVLVNVAVGRPDSNVHFRINSDPENMLESQSIIKAKDGSSEHYYFITEEMRDHPRLVHRWRWMTIFLGVTWPGSNIFLWPIPEATDFKVWKSTIVLDAQTLPRVEMPNRDGFISDPRPEIFK